MRFSLFMQESTVVKVPTVGMRVCSWLIVLVALLSPATSYGIATRYQVTAPNAPTGSATVCQGGAVGSYSDQPGKTSCSIIGSSNTNTITYQWVYDGTTPIAGASGTFVVNSSTPAPVTLSPTYASVLATLSPGAHTLACKFTPNQSNCSGTAGVAVVSPSKTITVLAAPSAVTGADVVCVGSTSTLASSPAGGTWSSSNIGNATVNSGGVVTGMAVGTARITYTGSSGCYSTKLLTINAAIAGITGPTDVCQYTDVEYTHPTSGGTWSISDPAVATISGGILNALVPGTATITYTVPSGCFVTIAVTVNAAPLPITGTNEICQDATSTLSSATPGGTWSSGASDVATVDAASGVVTGVANGTATVSYTLSSGCSATNIFSVDPLPDVSITPVSATLCMGETSTLNAASAPLVFTLLQQNFNSGLGNWVVSGTASPANRWQIVSPATAADGTPGDGTDMLQAAALSTLTTTIVKSPSFSTVGFTSVNLSFDQYLLSIIPDVSARIDYSIDGGASWTTIVEQGATLMGASAWGGMPNTTLALPAGALGQADVTLRWYYDASQYYWFLDNIKVNADLPAPTYTWSGGLGLSCTGCASPAATPTSIGENVYSVTATSSTGCIGTATASVSVNPLPGAITGNLSICAGSTSTLANTTTGGTWTVSNAKASIVPATGLLTGISAGTVDITYTLPSGCFVTEVATVAPAPATISGDGAVCEGNAVSLTHVVTAGTWISSDPGVATVNSFGVVSAIASGTTTITYTLPSGCITTRIETVNEMPGAITGMVPLCVGNNVLLSSSTGGGAWIAGDAATAGVSGGGLVSGVSEGIAPVTYQLPSGCQVTALATINPLPAPITGSTNICQGASSTLSNTTAGGTWASTNPGVATINASGTLTGVTPGFASVSYTLSGTGCSVSVPIIVNTLPASITGITEVCKDDNTALGSSPSGGAWTSSNASKAVVDPSSGIVTGVAAGVAIVTYTLPVTGCSTSVSVTVNSLPTDILGTATTCVGSSTNLFNFTSGGVWSSDNTLIADISAAGVTTGVSSGVTQVRYTNAVTGCYRALTVTVNATPSSITGPSGLCIGQSANLGNSDGGGTWSSSNVGIASIGASTGVVTGNIAGSAVISYTLPTGCVRTMPVVVYSLPGTIVGPASVCEQQTITLSNGAPGGSWLSDNPAIASVDVVGNVTGNLAGVTTISYTSAAGCSTVRALTVNAKPAAISGFMNVCTGSVTTISNATLGGIWSSGSPMILSVGATTGVVSGVAAGVAEVTYSLPTGCRTTGAVTVNPVPAPITGTFQVCQNASTTLSNASVGGSWSTVSSNASVDGVSGLATGLNAGTASVVYTLATGCSRSVTVTVNPLPAPITGALNVCVGANTALTNSTSFGNWSSSNLSIAYISASGVATGVSNGVAVITYTLPATGCSSVASLVVNPLPAAIAGADAVCMGQSESMANATPSGVWSASSANVGVDGSGSVTGISAGSAEVSYTLFSGCFSTKTITVNPLPAAIVAPASMCKGSIYMLASATPGGTWSVGDASIAFVNPSTGATLAANVGTTNVAYTLPTGCASATVITVSDVPGAITGTASVCAGSTATLSTTSAGGTWSTSSGLATVNSGGDVTGIAAGISTITYTGLNGCRRLRQFTVNALPALIAGPGSVCDGLTAVYSNASLGGMWTSSDETVAQVGSLTGIVTAAAPGSASISYTLPNGCYRQKSITVHPSVEAITGDLSVCVGNNASLTSLSAGGVWISNNTSRLSVDPATGVATGISSGTVIVSYTLLTGCSAAETITVNALPLPISGMMPLCVGSTLSLSSASAGGSWSGADPLVATVDASGLVSGIGAGLTSVSYTLPTGCLRVANVNVNAVPAVTNVTGGGAYCAGGTGVSVGVDNSESGTIYRLMLAGTLIATTSGTGAALDFGLKTAAGTYTVIGKNGAGCSATMAGDATIVITPLVTPSVSVSVSADTVCAGTSVDFIATGLDGGSAPAYVWSVAGVPAGTGSSFSHVPVLGEPVSVTLTSSHDCPSVSEVSATAVVGVIPQLTPAVSIATDAETRICQGTPVTFSATEVNGGTSPVYTWLVNGSIVPGALSSTYSYIPAKGQSVVCKMISSYRCPSVNNVSSNVISLIVDSVYIPAVTIVAEPGTNVKQGVSVTFMAHVSGAGPSPKYQWLVSGAEVPGATTATFVSGNLENGDSVTCTVTGSGACGKASLNSVIMSIEPTGITPLVISGADLKLMPNPTNGSFVISGTVGSKVDEAITFEVTDMLGQVVCRGNTIARAGSLNERIELKGTLANGMYMLSVSNGNDRKLFHFVLKQ
ncbi:MAG: T9SS type A sorting domain-containing protein [Taibaiella sp.]|nr:T9SS type A sorting domain-containing protein [Taibaiella sp.]